MDNHDIKDFNRIWNNIDKQLNKNFLTEIGAKKMTQTEKNGKKLISLVNLVVELETMANAEDNEYGQALLEASADMLRKYLSKIHDIEVMEVEPAELNEDLGAQND